ncbi:MAG: LptF/LptG family permease [Brumimicrobium sp.]
MKKLTKFFIKSFIGPFLATFFISMFMLVMQFLWKYIDDLMGKGLEINIILELLFYVSAGLLPLALPLAILLSSLMVMGNLGERLELTALKASGLSIQRILRPLIGVTILIAIGTFYFANYVIPVANYKWHSIIWDIQEKKMASFLRPGVYTQEIEGFSIKIKEGKGNQFKDIIIHDRRQYNELKTIVADSGELYQAVNGEFLFFKLFNGNIIEEMSEGPSFQEKNDQSNFFPSRKSYFDIATFKLEMVGFQLQRSKDDLFKDDYEMLNVFQINEAADSIRGIYNELVGNLSINNKNRHSFFRLTESKKIFNDTLSQQDKQKKDLLAVTDTIQEKDTSKVADITPIYNFDDMDTEIRERTINSLKYNLRNNIQSIDNQQSLINGRINTMKRFEIKFHQKIALAFSIIILFFIGAPLGAIVKKGGFGAPVVIAALIFMIYYVMITIGEEMAEGGIVSPVTGIWGPSIILLPVAVILMIAASHDGNFRFFIEFFKRQKK